MARIAVGGFHHETNSFTPGLPLTRNPNEFSVSVRIGVPDKRH